MLNEACIDLFTENKSTVLDILQQILDLRYEKLNKFERLWKHLLCVSALLMFHMLTRFACLPSIISLHLYLLYICELLYNSISCRGTQILLRHVRKFFKFFYRYIKRKFAFSEKKKMYFVFIFPLRTSTNWIRFNTLQLELRNPLKLFFGTQQQRRVLKLLAPWRIVLI